MLRRVLIGLSTLTILIVGAMGMKALMDMREPPQRQVLDNPGPVVRVVAYNRGTCRSLSPGSAPCARNTSGALPPKCPGRSSSCRRRCGPACTSSAVSCCSRLIPAPSAWPWTVSSPLDSARKEIAVLQQQRKITWRRSNWRAPTCRSPKKTCGAMRNWRARAPFRRVNATARGQVRNEALRAVQGADNLLALNGPRIEQAEAAIQVARAELEEAKLQLGKTRLLAPADGQFVQTTLDLGEFVSAGRKSRPCTARMRWKYRLPCPWRSFAGCRGCRRTASRPRRIPIRPRRTAFPQPRFGGREAPAITSGTAGSCAGRPGSTARPAP